MIAFDAATRAIIEVGARLDRQGLAPATAGNYSVRLPDGTIALTVSGGHKGRLRPEQIMRASADGAALDGKRPSAETLLHCLIYAVDASAGGVLHTHSVAGVVLSRALRDASEIVFDGYELLKIFPGVDTHQARVAIPLVENSQDMRALAELLRPLLARQHPIVPAFYIRGHGLYAWGPTIAEAEYVAEAVEYLLACELEMLKLEESVMTTLKVYDLAEPHALHRETDDVAEIAACLAPVGIRFERWRASVALPEDASDEDVIRAYRADIDRLMADGGYRSCDVIRLLPDNPARDALRTKFLDEHVHGEDEVRFFVEGSGVFYIRGAEAVYALQCTRDDLIAVPEGTRHWFDMGPAPRFTAIRLFAEPDGWVATFTGDTIARGVPLYEGAA